MITKYIGSPDDFINCESVGFMMVIDDKLLIPGNLQSYTFDNPLFYRKLLVNRNSEGIFVADFTNEYEGFIVNNLVMYNTFGEPIGYCDLTQDIDIDGYGIEKITLSFDYVIVNKAVQFNYNINYNPHLVKTADRRAHLNLFDDNLYGLSAASKSRVNSIKPRQLFTKNLISARHNKSLIYRYSGKLSKGTSYYQNDEWLIHNSYIIPATYLEHIVVDGKRYLLSYISNYGGTLHIIPESGNILSYKMNIESPLHMGSNIIIARDDVGKYIIYSIQELIHNHFEPIKLGTMDSSDYVHPVTKFCKDPFTKCIMSYRIENNKVVTDDIKLSSYISDFQGNLIDCELIYASKGLLLAGTLTSDLMLTSIKYFTFSLPGRSSIQGLIPIYNDYDIGKSDENKKLFDELMIGTYIKDIVFLTPELMIVNKDSYTLDQFRSENKNTWNDRFIKTDLPIGTDDPYTYYIDFDEFDRVRGAKKFLITVTSDVNYDVDGTSQFHDLMIRNMMGRTGLMNFDLIVKNYSWDLNQREFLSISDSGCLLSYKLEGSYCNITKL